MNILVICSYASPQKVQRVIKPYEECCHNVTIVRARPDKSVGQLIVEEFNNIKHADFIVVVTEIGESIYFKLFESVLSMTCSYGPVIIV